MKNEQKSAGNEAGLAAAIAALTAGEAVDWDSTEHAAADPERPVVRNLQALAEVFAAHEQALQQNEAVAGTAEGPVPAVPPTTWGPLQLIERSGEGACG